MKANQVGAGFNVIPLKQEELSTLLVKRLNDEVSTADLVGLGPEDCSRLVALGVASFAGGYLERASEVFRVVARLWPSSYVAHHYLGMICDQKGLLEHAVRHYEVAGEAIEALGELNPEQRGIHRDITFLLADALSRQGHVAEARLFLAELLSQKEELDPVMVAQVEALANQGE